MAKVIIKPSILYSCIDEDDENCEWTFSITASRESLNFCSDANKCESCKHIFKRSIDQPCADCSYNGINVDGTNNWEAKDESNRETS